MRWTHGSHWGDAIYHLGGDMTVSNSVFIGNSAEDGGAIWTGSQQNMIIENCLFVDNQVVSGGAIRAEFSFGLTIRSCTLDGNRATTGSGISIMNYAIEEIEIRDTLITNGVLGAGIDWDDIGTPTIACTDIHGNAGGDWVGPLADHLGVDGNISVDPLYCGSHNPDDPWTLDASSPCLDLTDCGRIGARGAGCAVTGVTSPLQLARLSPCKPNPFNPRTTISFDLTREARVGLMIFDAAGRLVRSLAGGEIRSVGHHAVSWDGTDDRGRAVAAGVYLCRLQAGDSIDMERLALIR